VKKNYLKGPGKFPAVGGIIKSTKEMSTLDTPRCRRHRGRRSPFSAKRTLHGRIALPARETKD